MLLDFDSFAQENGIITRSDGHKHCRPGWVQIKCPFCSGHDGWHLGFEYATGRFTCWRCGWHHASQVIMVLTGATRSQTQYLLRKYQLRPSKRHNNAQKRLSDECNLPIEAEKLQDRHKQYLESRNFDPDELEGKWGLKGTGPIGNYKFRIIAPIVFNGELISWQGRDITEKAQNKYMTCSLSESVIDPKHVLYGIDYANSSSVVVCEGVTDVWRLGFGAVATFGIKWRIEQMKLLRQYQHIYILFDFAESEAEKQAEKLAHALEAFCDVELIEPEIEGDPGDMNQEDADSMMDQLLSEK